MKVLIVDDTKSVRERLTTLIAEVAGVASVTQAADGTEAMAAIATLKPDVLVLDIRMAGMNGFEVLGALDAMDGAPTRVVVSNHPEYRRAAYQLGARFFFDKSTELADLVSALGELAQARK